VRRGPPGLIEGLGPFMPEAYVPLARKWRPRSFADVVGQEEIVRALTNAVSHDRLAHAYLFAGQRGVGKTTSARLLAAAINCHSADAPTPTPCGTCVSCVEIFEGRSMDAQEIDGATHGKVDQARDLIEVVSYAPARDRRKVFIIDEVHAISQAAFQALLKTLEEPPPHVVFILATTERHKIPATILSRCQRFEFRRLTDEEVAERLAEVARREGFEVVEGGGFPSATASQAERRVERPALFALASAATGSLRDALSLFDQAVARAGSSEGDALVVRAADVDALLGAPDRSALVSMLAALLSGDRAAVLKRLGELEASAADPRTALHDLTSLVRGAVRMAADPSAPQPTGLSESSAAELAQFARSAPYQTLLRTLSLLVEGGATLRRSDTPSLVLEVLLLKVAELPRLVPLEELLAGKASLPPAGALPQKAAPAASARPALSAPAPVRAAPTAPPPAPPAPPAEPRFVALTRLEPDPDPVPSTDAAASFKAEVEKRYAPLAAVLDDASITVDGKLVRIVLDPPNAMAEKRLAEPAMRKTLEGAAVAVAGRGARVEVESAMPPAGDLTAAAAAADPEALERENLQQRVASDERVQKMLELFGGQIVEVRRHDSE